MTSSHARPHRFDAARRLGARLLALFGLAVLAFALAACGGDGGEEEGEPTPSGTVPVGPGGSVPTTTPLAQVPEPTIVTGDGGGSSSDVSYTVEAGDTLGTIAQRFGVPIDEIREANDLTDDNIFVGQELTIPRVGATPPAGTSTPGTGGTPPAATPTVPAATATAPPSGSGNVHVVESGDTPLGIALQYGITLEELEEANGGPFGVLQIGQEIIIP